jgi:hypothetical protein
LDLDVLWNIAEVDLPLLVRQLEQLVED